MWKWHSVSAVVLGSLLFTASLPASAQPAAGAQAPTAPPSKQLSPELPLRRDDGVGGALWQAATAWLLVLGLAGVAVWLVRRGKAGSPLWPMAAAVSSRGTETPVIRWTRNVAPAQSLHLLEWDGHEMLVGCTSGGFTVLRSRPLAPVPAAAAERDGGRSA